MEERFNKILAIALDLKVEEVNSKMSSETVDNWDSLKQMNIIVAMEEEFEISFDEAESILLNTYSSLLVAVREKLPG